jgi:ATP-dependent Clp protease protease subunit
MTNLIIDGELCLYGIVGSDWEDGFTASDVLLSLAELGRDSDIVVRLNSPGGIAVQGVAIYNALAAHRGKVTIFVDAIALSAASLIAMAADDLVMRLGSLMMIHDPAGLTMGTVQDHQEAIIALDKLGDVVASIYAERTNRTTAEARTQMRDELWLTGEEAVAQGYAHRLDVANDDIKARAVAMDPIAFNYRIFKNPPDHLAAIADARAWTERAPKAASPAATNRQQENLMPVNDPAGEKPVIEATNVVSIDEARAAGRADAIAYVQEITEICALAGKAELATAFIAKETKAADVRKELLEARASADAARTVTNTIPQKEVGQSGGLTARMQQLVAKGA